MVFIALFFILLGILIKYGKMYFLIAGYNTLPPAEKKKYNIEGIATIFRNAMFGMAFLILLGYFISEQTNNVNFKNYAFWIAILLGTIYLLIVSNSKKYKIDS